MVLNPGPPFFAEPRQGQLAVTNQSSHPTGADKAERRQLCQDLKGKAPGVGPMSGYTEGQEPQASALSTCKALGHILPGALHLLDNHSRRERGRAPFLLSFGQLSSGWLSHLLHITQILGS